MKDRVRELEIKVIALAKEDHKGGCAAETCGGTRLDPCSLYNAIQSLTFECPECNAGGHTCPGDGEPIPHGAGDCGQHGDVKPVVSNEHRRLADYLSEYGHGVVEEWMRIVEVDEDVLSPGSGAQQLRVTYAGDSTFILGESPHGDEHGRYRLMVKVDALPDLPPIGPENDPAQQHESPWVAEMLKPEWVSSTFLHIEKGDRLRIGQDEATVLKVSKLNWHADNINPRYPKAWEHVELRADLGFGMSPFPTDTPVEILCDVQRRAQLNLSHAGVQPQWMRDSDRDA